MLTSATAKTIGIRGTNPEGKPTLVDVNGLVQNLLASAVWLVLGIVLTRAYVFSFRTRHLRRCWDLPRDNSDIHIVTACLEPHDTKIYKRPATGLGELKAVAHISESLQATYRMKKRLVHVDMSDDFHSSYLECSTLIVIGGPRHNRVTRLLWDHTSTRFNYVLEPVTMVHDSETGVDYRPVMKEGERRTDYGIVFKMPNPFAPEYPVIVMSGAHTFGVSATAKMFTRKYIRQLADSLKHCGDYWQVLLQVECIGSEYFPSIIAASKLDAPKGVSA